VSRWCKITLIGARFSIRRCVCMLWCNCGTGAGMWVSSTDIWYFCSLRWQHVVSPDTCSGHSRSKCLGIPAGQTGSRITSACLALTWGAVQPSREWCAGSPTAHDVLDFHRSPALMTLERHYFEMSPTVTGYSRHSRTQSCLSEKLISKHAQQ